MGDRRDVTSVRDVRRHGDTSVVTATAVAVTTDVLPCDFWVEI